MRTHGTVGSAKGCGWRRMALAACFAVGLAAARAEQGADRGASEPAPGTYDPKRLMPLALTESIKRDWGRHRRYFLGEDNAMSADLAADHRNVVHVEYRRGGWGHGAVEFTFYNNPHAWRYDTSGANVTVAAGTFRACIETVEKVHAAEEDGGVLLWETHSFWAPDVGLVRECQRLPDGTETYTLELLRFERSAERRRGDDARGQ